MEKYDRDVEQKQHELDVLKVCISHFMLVSKRSARARARTLYPPPPPPLHPTHHCARYARNEPFSSCLKPLFQSEAKSEAIDMKMSFYSQGHKTHFPHNKGFALSLTLTVSVWNSAMANWWRSF